MIVSDGVGGAIITWYEARDWETSMIDIYAQRVDASGNVLWPVNGVPVCTTSGNQMAPEIVTDGAQGAIIAWTDFRWAAEEDIYAQRLDAWGNALWRTNGVPICTLAAMQRLPAVVSDGSGGAYLAWGDDRDYFDVYAQHVDASGNMLWTTNGKAIAVDGATRQWDPCMAPGGAGGAVIAWADGRGGEGIYAQRVDGAGNFLWAANGVPIFTGGYVNYYVKCVSDLKGGAIVTWTNNVSFQDDIYAQRVNASGTALWGASGVAICGADSNQVRPEITTDGASGAIITWLDHRYDDIIEVYLQSVDSSGVVQWADNGIPVTANNYHQGSPDLWPDGYGGVYVTFTDYRNGTYQMDVYLQGIDGTGLPHPAPIITDVSDVPGDQGGEVTVTWLRSSLDASPHNIITRYSMWRRLPEPATMRLLADGADEVDWEFMLPMDHAMPVVDMEPEPVYRFTTLSGVTYGWEFLDYIDAIYLETYIDTFATLYDSSDATSGYHHFMVTAHTADQWTFWDSEPDSGYSVDNIPPSMPGGAGSRQSHNPEGLELKWNRNTESDFRYYRIYRGDEGGGAANQAPSQIIVLTETQDTTYFDDEWRWYYNYYYKIAAVDIHGNESPCDSIGRGEVTGGEVQPTLRATFLAQNIPNPFNPTTAIVFGLHEAGYVSLRVFDAAGRFVHELVNEHRPIGVYKEFWNGRNGEGHAVASGVYFYRLDTGAFSQTKKMVLIR
jgi:hypothetical protein